MLARRADAENPRVLDADFIAQAVLGRARAEPPDLRRVAQLGDAVVDVKVARPRGGAAEDDTVVARRLEIRSPETAGRAAPERVIRQRAQIDRRHLRAARRKAVAGERSGHDDDAVFGTEGPRVER